MKKQHLQGIRSRQTAKSKKKPGHQTTVPKTICPKCGNSLTLRNGKHGSFYGCINNPKCRFTSQVS